jgi:hypothetical protein
MMGSSTETDGDGNADAVVCVEPIADGDDGTGLVLVSDSAEGSTLVPPSQLLTEGALHAHDDIDLKADARIGKVGPVEVEKNGAEDVDKFRSASNVSLIDGQTAGSGGANSAIGDAESDLAAAAAAAADAVTTGVKEEEDGDNLDASLAYDPDTTLSDHDHCPPPLSTAATLVGFDDSSVPLRHSPRGTVRHDDVD